MQGYEVITNDGHKVGRVVGTDGDNLVVQRGTILKSRYAVPQAVTSTDRSEQKVHLDVSRNVLEEGPKLDNGTIDEEAVAAYYGPAGGEAAPETEGYGELKPDDPARGSERDARAAGVEPAEQQRARIREHLWPEAGEGSPSKGAGGIHQDYWVTKK